MNPPLISGLIAAPFTPFGPDGSLAPSRIPQLCAALAAQGVAGAFVGGTTGEGSSLTIDERKHVTEAWVRARPSGFLVIAHVGHNCLADATDLARHAAAARADAIAMIAPNFFRPATLDDLVATCAVVASAAPQLPFYYYHMPAMTGVDFSMAALLARADGRIPNLAGVKFTHENLMDFSQALAVAPDRYTVFHGRDEILLAGLALGARAAVGSTYNFMAPVYRRLLTAFAAGDLAAARREQASAVQFISLIARHGGLAGGKATMRLIGLDCGGVRLPVRDLAAEGRRQLASELAAAGFFEAIGRPAGSAPAA